MYAIVLAVLGGLLVSWNFAMTVPQRLDANRVTAADVAAGNFWSYWLAVGSYQYAHPGTVGPTTVPDGSLTFEPGYVRNPAWTNVLVGGKMYTYSNAQLPNGTVDAIFRRGGGTRVIGIAQANATLKNLIDGDSSLTIPASIPAGAVVVIGN
jgi:hypothetical protein